MCERVLSRHRRPSYDVAAISGGISSLRSGYLHAPEGEGERELLNPSKQGTVPAAIAAYSSFWPVELQRKPARRRQRTT